MFYGTYVTLPLNRPILGMLDLQNIPATDEVMLTHLASRLEFPNGENFSYTGSVQAKYGVENALRTLLPGFEWLHLDNSDPRVEYLSVPKYKYNNLSTRPGTYTGEAQFELYRDEVISEVPLIVGSRINFNQNPISIADIEYLHEAGGVGVYLHRVGLTSDTYRGDELKFCLLNRTRRQALSPSLPGGSNIIWGQELILFGLVLEHPQWNLNFFTPSLKGKPAYNLDDAWLADARLAVIKRIPIGRFSKTFEIKNFRMADYETERPPVSIPAGK
jgi:hypothetical protein